VPAAAVIPAPIAYIKVVAVKKLVVELESVLGGVDLGAFPGRGWLSLSGGTLPAVPGSAIPNKSSFPISQGL
jgi:hypothetical protein